MLSFGSTSWNLYGPETGRVYQSEPKLDSGPIYESKPKIGSKPGFL